MVRHVQVSEDTRRLRSYMAYTRISSAKRSVYARPLRNGNERDASSEFSVLCPSSRWVCSAGSMPSRTRTSTPSYISINQSIYFTKLERKTSATEQNEQDSKDSDIIHFSKRCHSVMFLFVCLIAGVRKKKLLNWFSKKLNFLTDTIIPEVGFY